MDDTDFIEVMESVIGMLPIDVDMPGIFISDVS
jgi:hypothetical protein